MTQSPLGLRVDGHTGGGGRMLAVVQEAYGGAEALELREIDQPRMADDEVLVRVVAAGVDRGAYHLMRGLPHLIRLMGYGLRAPRQLVPGTNLAGRVVAVGASVSRFEPGDEVYGTCRGAFAQYAAAKANRLAPKPEVLSFEEAAALPYAGCVSLQAVRDHGAIEGGERVLIMGASGAVGTVAVQCAKAVGAEVTGVGSGENADLVLGLGADQFIDYRARDVTQGPDLYDVVLDIGGNTALGGLRAVLEPQGTLVIIGGEGGGRWIGGIQRQLGARLLSPFVRQRLRTFIAKESAEELLRLNTLVEASGVRPVLGRVYPLPAAADAVHELDGAELRGRLVLTVEGD